MKTKLSLVVFLALAALGAQANVIISPSAGFSITYDGNDGDFFDATPPPTGSQVPANLALSGTAFASSVLNSGGYAAHQTAHLNDGFYGNNNSWIGDTLPANAGILLDNTYAVTSFAFGRDNGNTSDSGAPAQNPDRSLGVYTIEMTSNGGSTWFTVGTLNYASDGDGVIGGTFDSYYRHEYTVSVMGGDPILANGIRIQVPGAGVGIDGTAIDEIEVYGTVVPEPATLVLVVLGLGLFGFRRRYVQRLS